MAAETAAPPTPLDVAVEYLALKQALAQMLDSLVGTSGTHVSSAMDAWTWESPIPFPRDESDGLVDRDFAEMLYRRGEEIEIQILLAVSGFLAERIEHLRACRGTETDDA